MKVVAIFAFFMIVSSVAEQDAEEEHDYEFCLIERNDCAFIEDTVRCRINELDLLSADVTQKEIEDARNASNEDLAKIDCTRTFDQILNDVKAHPQLLDLQDCMDIAATKGRKTPEKFCTYMEEAVRCGIKAMGLQKEDASSKDLEFGRELATRYLTGYKCSTTFDEIFKSVKNSGGSTFSPIGWLTAVMVGFIVMFTAVY